jgi:hypothetical protein
MPQFARSTVTLVVLVGLLVLGALWGWSEMTAPLPGKADAPTCVSRAVQAGDKVFPDMVTVSVLNASERNGLASRTLQLFTDAGFGSGDTANAPQNAEVAVAQIWTSDPDNPGVQLVRSWLGPRAEIVDREGKGAGVVVVVGDDFEDLVKGERAVKASDDATVCTPPVA